MTILLDIGLALSLGGQLLLLLASKRLKGHRLSLPYQICFSFLLAIIVIVLAACSGVPWLNRLGLQPLGWLQLAYATAAIIAVLVGSALLGSIQNALGGADTKQKQTLQKLIDLPLSHKVFVVVTGVVAEEILYRGYAIGIGQHVFGSVTIAFIISLVAFIAAHVRWGFKYQVIAVLWPGVVLSLLFVLTNNMFACILAHLVVNTVGISIESMAYSRRRRAAARSIEDG